MSEPQTEAGRRFAVWVNMVAKAGGWDGDEAEPAILAIEAESRNATLDEVVRVVEGLESRYPLALERAAVLDAVKALQSPERDQG